MDFLAITDGRWRQVGLPLIDGLWRQLRVYNHNELMDFLETYNGIYGCYISACEYRYYGDEVAPYPRFFMLDFDDNINKSADLVEDVAKVVAWAESEGYGFRVHRSGCKGYHVIFRVNLREPWDDNISKVRGFYSSAFHAFMSEIVHELDLKCVDPAVKDFARLMRIPGTINTKCDRMCETVYTYEGAAIDLNGYGNTRAGIDTTREIDIQFGLALPCVEKAIRTDHPSHDMRRWAVQLRKLQGKTKEQIIDEFRGYRWEDWDEVRSAYYVDYYYGGFTFRCRKDFCLGMECPFRQHLKLDSELGA